MEIKTFDVSYFFIRNQCYLANNGNNGILVDPAWNYTFINDFLISNEIILKGILLTHAHVDHVNLARQFAKNYNIPVFMSGTEIDSSGFNCLNLERTNHLHELVIGDFKILPILTPGHTCGSNCYLIDGHLFSGDTVFIEGVGICVGKGSDVNQMYESIQFLKHYLPEDTLFWPGHSFGQLPGKNLEFLLKNNIYFQFENRDHFIDFRMRKNQPDPFSFK